MASLYLFWSLWGGPRMEGSQPNWGGRPRDLAEPSRDGTLWESLLGLPTPAPPYHCQACGQPIVPTLLGSLSPMLPDSSLPGSQGPPQTSPIIPVPHADRAGHQGPSFPPNYGSRPCCPSSCGQLRPSPVHQRQDVEHGGHVRVAVA